MRSFLIRFLTLLSFPIWLLFLWVRFCWEVSGVLYDAIKATIR